MQKSVSASMLSSGSTTRIDNSVALTRTHVRRKPRSKTSKSQRKPTRDLSVSSSDMMVKANLKVLSRLRNHRSKLQADQWDWCREAGKINRIDRGRLRQRRLRYQKLRHIQEQKRPLGMFDEYKLILDGKLLKGLPLGSGILSRSKLNSIQILDIPNQVLDKPMPSSLARKRNDSVRPGGSVKENQQEVSHSRVQLDLMNKVIHTEEAVTRIDEKMPPLWNQLCLWATKGCGTLQQPHTLKGWFKRFGRPEKKFSLSRKTAAKSRGANHHHQKRTRTRRTGTSSLRRFEPVSSNGNTNSNGKSGKRFKKNPQYMW